MSHYGPPSEPGRRGPEEYGPPSDPWGSAPVTDSWNDYGATQPPYSSYDPYGEPHHARAMPPPRRNAGLYAVVALLVVLAASGVGYALYLLSGDDGETTAGGGTPAPTTSAAPSTSPGASASPRDNVGMNAAMAQVDDCLVNDGTDGQPEMRIVPCDTDEDTQVFQVLAIFSERVDGEGDAANEQAQAVCADTEGYKFHYYEVSENASFVLCMTDRS
jgi:hypothetical protein